MNKKRSDVSLLNALMARLKRVTEKNQRAYDNKQIFFIALEHPWQFNDKYKINAFCVNILEQSNSCIIISGYGQNLCEAIKHVDESLAEALRIRGYKNSK